MADAEDDEIPLSRLAGLLAALSPTPSIWLPRTSGGHTRQYFPIHEAGITKNTGSAVFDTFATVAKDQPLLFHWPETILDDQQQFDLNLILGRMTYFGRAESWSRAQAHIAAPEQIAGVITEDPLRPIGAASVSRMSKIKIGPMARSTAIIRWNADWPR